jgi:ABC-type branched-subunit amino acid transport system ATPase component
MPILQVDDIHTYYGDAYVLQGLSLELGEGQILGLLGRNGVGKTTLVNSIMVSILRAAAECSSRGRTSPGFLLSKRCGAGWVSCRRAGASFPR